MSQTRETTPPAARKARRGYDKGDETRLGILESALIMFGEAGYAAVTTRQIAAAAGVNLPALSYYFGGKEGLYLACAEEVIDHWRRHAQEGAEDAAEALESSVAPEEARRLLKLVFADLKSILEDSNVSKAKLEFLSREMHEPGPAYELLYTQLWRPGVEIVAALIAAVREKAGAEDADRLEALLMLSNLSVATHGRTVTMRTMGWKDIGPEELSTLFATIDRQIDALGGR